MVHIDTYALADKFRLEAVKDLCLKRFNEDFWGEMEDPGWNYGQDGEALTNLLASIRRVYTTTPPSDRGFRMVLLYAVHGGVEDYRLLQQPAFTSLLREIPDLAIDLIKSTLSQLYCSSCETSGYTAKEACGHDDWKSCQEENCIKDLLCFNCHMKGSLEPIERDSDTEGYFS